MDIFSSLRLDHVAIRDNLSELVERGTGPTSEGDWTTLFHDLKLAVLGHNRAEEKIFYEVLHEIPGRADLARAKTREHHLLEEILEDIEEIDPVDDTWSDKLSLLENTLDAHIEEEEANVFPILQSIIDENRSRQMAEDFETLRDQIIEGAPYHPKGKSMINPAGLDLTR